MTEDAGSPTHMEPGKQKLQLRRLLGVARGFRGLYLGPCSGTNGERVAPMVTRGAIHGW